MGRVEDRLEPVELEPSVLRFPGGPDRLWMGRDVLRALSTGLAGCPSNGPSGEGPRATLMPCPRSVPPSAISRYQESPRWYRCGASGNFSPAPDHSERGASSALPAAMP